MNNVLWKMGLSGLRTVVARKNGPIHAISGADLMGTRWAKTDKPKTLCGVPIRSAADALDRDYLAIPTCRRCLYALRADLVFSEGAA